MSLRTGTQYLESLRDGRRVMYDGELVADVTQLPEFRRGARTVAQFYDFQNIPELRELMTTETEDGERAPTGFILPRSRDDLRKRAAAFAAWAEVTCGFSGRSPDYMNTCLAMMRTTAAHQDKVIPGTGKRVITWFEKCRREDLCLTHSFIQPFADRADRSDTGMKVTREKGGLRMSGIRGVATIAPFSNFNLAMEQEPFTTPDGAQFLAAFMAPVADPTVTWISRDSFNRQVSHDVSPLANRGDEIDGIAIFKDTFVPYEDLLTEITPFSLVGKYYRKYLFMTYAAIKHHNVMRSTAKMRFIFGLAHLVAESSRINTFPNIKERLGEISHMAQTMEAFAAALIEGASEDPDTGYWHVNNNTAQLACAWFGQYYARAVDLLMEMSGGRLMSTPQKRTMDVLGPALEKYMTTNVGSNEDSTSLFRLVWDVCGSSWGVRQELYEKFSVGNQGLRRMRDYDIVDKSQAVAMVERILHEPYTDERPYPLPKKK